MAEREAPKGGNEWALKVALRPPVAADLPTFFAQQLDPEANWMAAFTAKNPADRTAFDAHWAKIMADEGIEIQTILVDGRVAGYVLSHGWFGPLEISYWLGREFWGQGIATRALSLFLERQETRPLHARVVKDNVASRRVLEKCGFRLVGEDKGFANGRGEEVEEYILTLGRADDHGK